jgi:hypothetical protein
MCPSQTMSPGFTVSGDVQTPQREAYTLPAVGMVRKREGGRDGDGDRDLAEDRHMEVVVELAATDFGSARRVTARRPRLGYGDRWPHDSHNPARTN